MRGGLLWTMDKDRVNFGQDNMFEVRLWVNVVIHLSGFDYNIFRVVA